MTSFIRDYVETNVNKIITATLTMIFVVSLISFSNISVFSIVFSLVLVLLNIFNFFAEKKSNIFSQIIIYELIALIGIFYINYLYVLVFVLTVVLLKYFQNRKMIISVITINSLTFLIIYFIFLLIDMAKGAHIWQILLSLFISVVLSIFIINVKEDESTINTVENEKSIIEQKYYDLLQEHKNVVILKDIMDIANNVPNITNMILDINQLLLRSFENIDYSTIFLYDQNRKEFNIASSNIDSRFHDQLGKIHEFDIFEDVINNTFGKVISSENPFKYPTASQRGICSAFCMPIHTNKNLIGLLLIESSDSSTFRDMDINQFNIVRYNMSMIIENKQWINKIEKMALVDGLTGVYNRNYLFQFLEEQFAWHKENNRKLCLVMFDIDHFKKFNDTYGHIFGDLVLKVLSDFVKKSIRDIDLVARYGGEEFIIILTDADKNIAFQRIEHIRKGIEDLIVKDENGTQAKVTVSFGIAEYNNTNYGITMKQLTDFADQALYRSKDNGRNQVTIYE